MLKGYIFLRILNKCITFATSNNKTNTIMIRKFTPEKIIELEPMEFFVFGSNIQGEHVGGAALFAVNNFKAVNGQGFGIQGNAYAIPTCIRLWDNKCNRYTKPFDNVNQIKPFVDAFISDAKRFHYSTFFVTKIGCGIAGFKVSEVAELFRPWKWRM